MSITGVGRGKPDGREGGDSTARAFDGVGKVRGVGVGVENRRSISRVERATVGVSRALLMATLIELMSKFGVGTS